VTAVRLIFWVAFLISDFVDSLAALASCSNGLMRRRPPWSGSLGARSIAILSTFLMMVALMGSFLSFQTLFGFWFSYGFLVGICLGDFLSFPRGICHFLTTFSDNTYG
jgi:hypothetical protein